MLMKWSFRTSGICDSVIFCEENWNFRQFPKLSQLLKTLISFVIFGLLPKLAKITMFLNKKVVLYFAEMN